MKRLTTILMAAMLLGACGGSGDTTTTIDDSSTTTTTATTDGAITTEAPLTTTTTTEAPPDTAPVVQTDVNLTARTRAVVLVADGDVLNVRTGPGTDYPILTEFGPTQTGIHLTGNYSMLGSSKWVEVDTPAGKGWCSNNYLTEEWTTPEVDVLWDMETPLAHLALAMAADEPLNDWIDRRGLWAGWAGQDLFRWRQDDLDDVMIAAATYPFPNTDCLEDCQEHTFAAGIADPFLDIYEDRTDDADFLLDDAILGTFAAGTLEEIIPTELENFHYVGWHDPGDSDIWWLTTLVFFERENNEVKVIGMVRDGYHLMLILPLPTITMVPAP